MRSATLLIALLVSLSAFAEPDFTARDLFGFLGVSNKATPTEIVNAYRLAVDNLRTMQARGYAVRARVDALTRVHNLLLNEYSRSVIEAYLRSRALSNVDPGSADQQQRFFSEYFRKFRDLDIEGHRTEFPQFHRNSPVETFPVTDYTLKKLEGDQTEEAVPEVYRAPLISSEDECHRLLGFTGRQWFLGTLLSSMLFISTHHYTAPREATVPGSANEGAPPAHRPVPIGAAPKPAVAATTPKPDVKPVTPENAAAGRGQQFRDKLSSGQK